MNQMHVDLTNGYEESDCMGTYTKSDPQCTKYCVFRLRCAIEREQNLRAELIEELVASDYELGGKMQ